MSIHVTAVEIDETLLEHLQNSLELCKELCRKNNIMFEYSIINEDFINYGSTLLSANSRGMYNKVILNPPYKKSAVSLKQELL